MAVFQERQSHHDSCRMHALHCIFGGPVFGSWPRFQAAVCDVFDRRQGFPAGTSRSVTAPGFMDFACQQVDPSVHATCFLNHEVAKKHAVVQVLLAKGGVDLLGIVDTLGLLVFARDHVWAVVKDRRRPSGWVTVDSLAFGPAPCSLPTLLTENVGFYLITKHKQQDHDHPRVHMRGVSSSVPESTDIGCGGADDLHLVRVIHAPRDPVGDRVGVRRMESFPGGRVLIYRQF